MTTDSLTAEDVLAAIGRLRAERNTYRHARDAYRHGLEKAKADLAAVSRALGVPDELGLLEYIGALRRAVGEVRVENDHDGKPVVFLRELVDAEVQRVRAEMVGLRLGIYRARFPDSYLCAFSDEELIEWVAEMPKRVARFARALVTLGVTCEEVTDERWFPNPTGPVERESEGVEESARIRAVELEGIRVTYQATREGLARARSALDAIREVLGDDTGRVEVGDREERPSTDAELVDDVRRVKARRDELVADDVENIDEVVALRGELAEAKALAEGALDEQARAEQAKWEAERERDRYIARAKVLEDRENAIRAALKGEMRRD